MKRSRFTEDQIIGILENEAGVSVADLCRRHGVQNCPLVLFGAGARAAGIDQWRRRGSGPRSCRDGVNLSLPERRCPASEGRCGHCLSRSG